MILCPTKLVQTLEVKFPMPKIYKGFINDDIIIQTEIKDGILEEKGLSDEDFQAMFARTFKIFFEDLIDHKKVCAIMVQNGDKITPHFFKTEE